jgi:hypothetical protein
MIKAQHKWIFLALLLIMPLCFGCASLSGGEVKQTITPMPIPNVKYFPEENTIRISGVKKVAVFPFADYSHQQCYLGIDCQWGGNIKIIEEVKDHLLSHGISTVVQEDVNTLLADHNIIRPVNKDKYLLFGTVEEEDVGWQEVSSPEHELLNYEHSPDMTRELMSVIERKTKKERAKSASPILQGATVGLSREKVMELGETLGVDLILRGRIIEFGYKDIGTINPFYRGFIPVALDSVKDILFGASESYGYENDLESIESILVGAGLGYIIGHQITDRSTSVSRSISPGLISRRTAIRDTDHDTYAEEGAAIGALSGLWASQRSKKAKRSTVVQMRIYAQDVKTGDVLWSNRAEVEFTPKSNFAYADNHPGVMFDRVIKEGVRILMDNFFSEAEKVFGEEEVIQKEGA